MLTRNSTETKNLAKKIAGGVLKSGPRRSGATILALQGDLGSGKTTFTQGFARSLGIKSRVISPTFLIFRKYNLKGKDFKNLFHVDLYRIKGIEELDALGFGDILKDKGNIVLIEWAEKIRKFLPRYAECVYFKHKKNKSERDILVT